MMASTLPLFGGMTGPPAATPSSSRVLRGVREKQEIVHELVEGRVGLIEAVARFRAAHRQSTIALQRMSGVEELPNDPEALCRTVIGWAHLELSDRPEQAEAVSLRLERELQTHLERHGQVRLPSIN